MERIAELEAALRMAFAKMDRARDILTDGKPTTDCNWGMLATEAIKHGIGWPMDRARPAQDDGGYGLVAAWDASGLSAGFVVHPMYQAGWDAAKAAPRLTDAERYQWLKPRLLGADFLYGDPSKACCALVFEIPGDMRVWADLDATIDAAIEAKVRGTP